MSEPGPSTFVRANKVVYCQVCTYPPEYCSYGSRLSKCKKWLADAHHDLFTTIYPNDASGSSEGPARADESKKASTDTPQADVAEKKLQAMTLEEKQNAEALKKERKAERKAQKEQEKLANSRIVIRRVERTKRKMTTSIQGLEAFSIDLKKASKLFANKFATGASVSKNAAGEDEIVIQGDVAYEVEEMLLKTTGKEGEAFGGKIPEDNIDVMDIKTKGKPDA